MENSQEQTSNFDILKKEVQEGIEGKNNSIPIGFNRLNKHIGIRKRIYTTIIGATGSGKSALLHNAYILNPFDWYIAEGEKTGLKLKILLFSMERSRIYTIAKWVSRKIFLDQGVLIPVSKLLGWWETKLSSNEHDLFLMYEDYIDRLDEVVTIIEGPQNPTGYYKTVKGYAEKNGRIEEISEYNKIYIPNHPNEIVLPMTDHLGISKLEKGLETKKAAIDKMSEYNRIFRDFYGYSPIAVSQLNRDLSNPMYQKMVSFEPTIDSAKETGSVAEDSDVVLSLFDPLRYKTTDPSYNADKFINQETGAKCFRSVKVLKNSYGEDDLRVGMAFEGATGIFKELPKPKEMESFDYDSIFKKTYFLK